MSIKTTQTITCDLCGTTERKVSKTLPQNTARLIPHGWYERSHHVGNKMTHHTHGCPECMAEYVAGAKEYDKSVTAFFAPMHEQTRTYAANWEAKGIKPPENPLWEKPDA